MAGSEGALAPTRPCQAHILHTGRADLTAQTRDWVTFGVILAVMLLLDLFAHRNGREQSRKAAIIWSGVWIGSGLLFALYVFARMGGLATEEYLAAYFIEKSLSVDNLFVFLLVFQSLRVAEQYQHRVLLWGILGALVFRAIAIFAGIAALERFEWTVYVFGGILIIAAIHAFREDLTVKEESAVVRWLSRHVPITNVVRGDHFFVKENGRRLGTPLLLALLTIELTDVVFAIDSVPAALSVTRDRFLVYSSNAFAILGLRSLYLVLARTIASLRYLHYGLAFVLAFAGVKMIVHDWFHIPPLISIVIVGTAITLAVVASLKLKGGRTALKTAEPILPAPGTENRG